MKKLLKLTGIGSIGAVLALLAACQTTGTTDVVAQKEAYLAQSGFKVITVTTPQQQQAVAGLTQGRVSAVTYNKKTYYVFPTGTKDKIYVGKQAQFNRYKQALAAHVASHPEAQQPDGGSARAGADGRTVSDAHARDRRTQPHRSSAVRWVWSDGRERPGRLVTGVDN